MIAHLENVRDDIARLCHTYQVESLSVFGSAATGAYLEGTSDYDFLVRFLPCTPADHARRYLGLLLAMEDLLETRVDLIETAALTNPYVKASADATSVLYYAA